MAVLRFLDKGVFFHLPNEASGPATELANLELANLELDKESMSQLSFAAMPTIVPDADAIASPGSRPLASFALPEDDDPSHGRRSLFLILSMESQVPNRFADLPAMEHFNYPLANNHG